MTLLIAALAIAAGLVLPLQALINAQLARATTGALAAATISFAVGTVALLATLLITRTPLPSLGTASKLPAWIWIGGVLGAMYVALATVAVPRLGAAGLISLIVLGQMVGSLALDHYGVLHAPTPITLPRVAGALLVIAGAVLVVEPWRSHA